MMPKMSQITIRNSKDLKNQVTTEAAVYWCYTEKLQYHLTIVPGRQKQSLKFNLWLYLKSCTLKLYAFVRSVLTLKLMNIYITVTHKHTHSRKEILHNRKFCYLISNPLSYLCENQKIIWRMRKVQVTSLSRKMKLNTRFCLIVFHETHQIIWVWNNRCVWSHVAPPRLTGVCHYIKVQWQKTATYAFK